MASNPTPDSPVPTPPPAEAVNDQGKEALNFQITLLIAHLVAGVAICFHFGFVNLAIWVLTVVFAVLATVAANRGERYRYPLTLRLVK